MSDLRDLVVAGSGLLVLPSQVVVTVSGPPVLARRVVNHVLALARSSVDVQGAAYPLVRVSLSSPLSGCYNTPEGMSVYDLAGPPAYVSEPTDLSPRVNHVSWLWRTLPSIIGTQAAFAYHAQYKRVAALYMQRHRELAAMPSPQITFSD